MAIASLVGPDLDFVAVRIEKIDRCRLSARAPARYRSFTDDNFVFFEAIHGGGKVDWRPQPNKSDSGCGCFFSPMVDPAVPFWEQVNNRAGIDTHGGKSDFAALELLDPLAL